MKRLIQHDNPEAVHTPLLLLAALRDVDHRAELAYAGEGRWWLGVVDPNDERMHRAATMMQQLAYHDVKNPRTVMLAKLNVQGFALIEAYYGNDPSGAVIVNPGEDEYSTTILADFEWRDAEWRRDQGAAHVHQRMLETMGEPERIEAEAKMKEYLANDGRAQFRRHMKGKVTFGYESSPIMAGVAGNSPLILPFQ